MSEFLKMILWVYWGYVWVILWLYWAYIGVRENGKENENYRLGFRFTGLWLAGNEGMEKTANYYKGLYGDYYKDPFLHT